MRVWGFRLECARGRRELWLGGDDELRGLGGAKGPYLGVLSIRRMFREPAKCRSGPFGPGLLWLKASGFSGSGFRGFNLTYHPLAEPHDM